MRLLIVVLLAIIGGCSTQQPLPPKVDDPITIVFADEFTPELQARFKHMARWQLSAWQADFNRLSKPFTLVIVKNIFHITNSQGWSPVSGACYTYRSKLVVSALANNNIKSLYHELCHLNIDSSENHSHGNWEEWNKRAAVVVLQGVQAIEWYNQFRVGPDTADTNK
jgi:hypothetical protein